MSHGEQIKRINDKLQQLLKQYDFLQKENEKLKAEIVPSKERETFFLAQIDHLEQQVIVLKTATGKMNEADKKELDKKLNGYLKEIDRCITMLSD